VIRKLTIIAIILFTVYFVYIFSSQDKSNGRIDYKSAVQLDIPAGYYKLNIPADVTLDERQAGSIFLEAVNNTNDQSLYTIKEEKGSQTILYLLNLSENTLQKREIHPSGTIVESTWRGEIIERITYAAEYNSFTPPGMAKAESKNLYH